MISQVRSVRTLAEFPDMPVRMNRQASGTISLASIGTGPLMMAAVNVANPSRHVIGQRVFAHADELPFLDLATLRYRGRETTVTEWTPAPPGMLRIGATLRLTLADAPDTVEITDFCLPTYRQV